MSMAFYASSSEPPSDRIGRLRHLIKTLFARAEDEPGTGNTAAKTDGRITGPLGQLRGILLIMIYATLNPL
jgi:hypothetical protein